ncbi:unnamed protein product [Ascophyllum nodosum]
MMVLALVSGYALWIGLWIGLKTPCVGAFVGPKIMSPVTGAEVTLLAVSSDSFLPRPSPLALLSSSSLSLGRSQRRNRKCRGQDSGRLRASMLLDFIKKRAQEGVEQTQNLVTAAQQGRLEEALKETSEYVKDRNAKFADGLAKSRLRLLGDLENLLGATGPLEETLERLEEALLQADIGATTSFQIIEDLRQTAKAEDRSLEADDIKAVLRATLIQVLNGGVMPPETGLAADDEDADGGNDSTRPTAYAPTSSAAITFADPSLGVPSVLFFMGANGMGKTTTVGKVASRLRDDGGQRVLLAAADTFRAAAVEQLMEWAERSGADIVTPLDSEERPPSVVSRAAQKAVAEGYDVLIVDTSGRLSNNYGLNLELKEMKKALGDIIPGAPHETLLVVDASVGRNAVDQARTWKEEVGVSALVVTKLDGTARGGFVVSIVSDLGVPVKLIGVGESLYDLRDFEPVLYVDSLLGYTPEDVRRLQARFEANPVLQKRMLARMREAQKVAEPYIAASVESYVEPSSKSRKKAKAAGGKKSKKKR